jgi:hypothetical protein
MAQLPFVCRMIGQENRWRFFLIMLQA